MAELMPLVQRLRDTAQLRGQFPEWLLRELEVAADEIERLTAEEDLTCALIVRQGELLTGVVNAIRGNPKPDCVHSHHDAAELAANLVREKNKLATVLKKVVREQIVGENVPQPRKTTALIIQEMLDAERGR